ncbi:STAS domain-containing protein [Streptomyces sp. NPDC002044]|uniref:STAS domain-containing protein n=1 Tax=Streptomyces sp. NPDC002044 TaxID=3154662 RepID=UPI0033324A17
MDTHHAGTYGADARNSVETRTEGDVRVVVMAGEFDMDGVDELRTALDPEADGVARFVLDVSGVTFADSTALSIMLQPALNRPVVLAGEIPNRLGRLLEVTGADRAFAVAPTTAEAMVLIVPPRRR